MLVKNINLVELRQKKCIRLAIFNLNNATRKFTINVVPNERESFIGVGQTN